MAELNPGWGEYGLQSNYVGRPQVTFYKGIDTDAVDANGDPAPRERDMLKITYPGDYTKIVNLVATERHKVLLFPNEWEAYQRGEDQSRAGKTLLRDLPASLLQGNMVEQAESAGVLSLEDVLGMPESRALQLGPAMRELRLRCMRWVETRSDRKQDAEIAALKKQVAALQASQEKPKARVAAKV